MKKNICPFCGIVNKQGTITCPSCCKVINDYTPMVAYKPKLKKNIKMLSLNDFNLLANSCVNSITNMDQALVTNLVATSKKLLEATIAQILTLLTTSKITNENIEKEITTNLSDLGYFWGLMTFFLGSEFKAKRISEYESKKYLNSISFPFAYYLTEIVNLAGKKLLIDNVNQKIQAITNQVLTEANRLFAEGQEESTQVKPKVLLGGLTAFSIELKQINISS